MQSYSNEDVWNIDGTGVFWKALPDNGFGQKVNECKGGRRSNQRFIVNGADKSESKPFIIWKSENPRCFKGFSCLLSTIVSLWPGCQEIFYTWLSQN